MKVNKTNTELAKLLKEGDMTAFDMLYHKYCRKLYNFVLMYLKQTEDAEEIVQDVFVKIWESKNKINENESFESFLFTIAYNATMSLLRKRVRDVKSREYLRNFQEVEEDKLVDEIHFKEISNKVDSLLKDLTPRQKEIFLLSREDGLSHKEIAKKLNISENTVNNHLVTSLKYLKLNIDTRLVFNALFLFLFLS